MSQTKTVRLDEEVINTLAKQRCGFESPNDCLKRILSSSDSCQLTKEECLEEPEDDES
jgi:hypothetical protein